MSNFLTKDLRKYFPNESISDLKKYLSDRRFRLHLIDRKNASDLSPILSERSFQLLDSNGKVIESLQDLDFEVFHGNVIPGVKVRHAVDVNNGNKLVKERKCLAPYFGKDNLLIAKRSSKSDLNRGYFNYQFINVYAIV